MHILVRETHSLDTAGEAIDLGQSPADVVFLSFSDSDLGALSSAWQAADGALPPIRLANIAQLKHPLSVDLYVEQVIEHARCVVIRLLGGLDYWRYGVDEIVATCRERQIALALVPGDGREDGRLAELSTVTPGQRARIDGHLREGGPVNMARALRLAAHIAGRGADTGEPVEPLPMHGEHALDVPADTGRPLAAIVFYRAYLMAGDIAPVEALARALDARGLDVRALHVASLKAPDTARFVDVWLKEARPAVLLNATGFSARLGEGPSPLDAADAPVLQLVLSGSSRKAWEGSARGLSQADLAMQVVLPELDGRLLSTAISFKEAEGDIEGIEFSRVVHAPEPDGIALAAERAAGWARLSATPRPARRVALVLSDYPGAAGQAAHAVGLDAIASTVEILSLMARAGYATGEIPEAKTLVDRLCEAAPTPFVTLDDYRGLLADLPEALAERIDAAWGPPQDDPAVRDGKFEMRFLRAGNVTMAVQPDRGSALDRKAGYHDPDMPPRHLYVAFHLWLRAHEHVDAMVHLGTHGTLEWLPGKAVALSGACFPAALLGGLPIAYPFIVNNPGEAAAAKRRLGAVTIGHLTPPLKSAGTHGAAAELERLIDEYAAADGLDRRRTVMLRDEILERAESAGLMQESGASAEDSDDDRLARLDAYLCDVKEMQIRDGLHVYARAPRDEHRGALIAALMAAAPGMARTEIAARLDHSADAEAEALIAALDGRFVPPGPAGAPTRGRADVLPTGRNLYTVDPRAIPTRSAIALAEKAGASLVARHMQDHGDWPRSLVIDLWGSAAMRTGGEDLALALVLMGVRPVWDDGSARVNGFEILPVARLAHPRVDVTLRISGFFRDAFESQIALFDSVVTALAQRTGEDEWNPLAVAAQGLAGEPLRRATIRIYGSAPGDYGTGVSERIERGTWDSRADLGAGYLAASSNAYGAGIDGVRDEAGFRSRIAGANAFVHQQDHRETDLFESLDYAAHEGGFAAAAESLGAHPALYHTDTTQPDAPRTRTLDEEVIRTVRGRTANPDWIAGMMRHGYRGAAEIARALDGFYGFAATLPDRFDRQFDLLFDATLGDEAVDTFLARENPAARRAMAARFDEAIRRDLWRPRRNAVATLLDGARQ